MAAASTATNTTAGAPDASEPGTHCHSLGIACMLQVFSHLSPEECASAARVHSLWRTTLSDDALWRAHFMRELGLDQAVLPPQMQMPSDQLGAPTFKAAYSCWRTEFSDVPWHFLLRAHRAWRTIEGFLARHAPFIGASLQQGAPRAVADTISRDLPMPLPSALRAIYRLHDGQNLAWDKYLQARLMGRPALMPQDHCQYHGLFGGYSLYDHECCCRMLPLAWLSAWKDMYEQQGQVILAENYVALAPSFRPFDKILAVDLATADVAVLRPRTGEPPLPALPKQGPSTAGAAAAASTDSSNDGVLRWFEEYARRLAAGVYEVKPLAGAADSRGICLFPASREAGMAVAVTRGVRVRASPLFVPEVSGEGQRAYAYSVRFKLLTQQEEEEEQREAAAAAGTAAHALATSSSVVAGDGGRRMSVDPASSTADAPRLASCQLLSRHWRICDGSGQVVDEVSGEAVVGEYPHLVPGAPEFSYQSCTRQDDDTNGSMKGHFKFVEGSIARPTGPSFNVECPEFKLQMPEYIY